MKKMNLFLLSFLAGSAAFAEDAVEVANTVAYAGIPSAVYYAFAAAFTIGLAAFGGALAQGKVGSAAMEGIGRNPNSAEKMQTPMILGLVFIETVVLFGLVIALLLVFK